MAFQRAAWLVNEVAAAEGVTSTVTHLVYTRHHYDHAGASSIPRSNMVCIGHEEIRLLLLRDNDPAKPQAKTGNHPPSAGPSPW
jgi:glyoxylase-like metal-dependent hydrolase (beta-lactamase superfamily II)